MIVSPSAASAASKKEKEKKIEERKEREKKEKKEEKLRPLRRVSWIPFVAFRYVSASASPSSIQAVIGIATGVLALTVILAVMNGLQMGFIESILEISSYHLRAEAPRGGAEPEGPLETARQTEIIQEIQDARAAIAALPEVAAAALFREFHGIIQSAQGSQYAVVIRGLEADAIERDPGLAEKLVFEEGSFLIAGKRDILLGAELAGRLLARVGDEITLVSVAGLFGGSAEAEDTRFVVRGIFRCGFYEYDLGWGFINLDAAGDLGGGPPLVGVKLKNRWQDRQGLKRAEALAETRALTLSAWRDYNRAFFGALRTEKLLMFVLVGLIFIVAGLNIFQSQRRAVFERREEIGLFRALGAGEGAARLVFLWDGAAIGFTGALSGLALGLLIAFNVNAIIAWWNGFAVSVLARQEFAVFHQDVYYIREIPSRVIPSEACLIFLFGFLSALVSAWFASAGVSKARPAEVLRYE
ncbi:MAG: ABC transporter permease [Spirochaetaceae bacterium]|jgi:lipoprotein-releasing system permease protein|nr:ABC transporter permease [Spirochaetaceae bacterium]